MCSRILIVDDDKPVGGPEGAVWAKSSVEAINRMKERRRWDILYLDHDLGGDDNAQAVLKWLEEEREAGRPIQFDRVFIHSMNPAGAESLFGGLKRLYPTRRIPLPWKRQQIAGDDHATGQPSSHPVAAGPPRSGGASAAHPGAEGSGRGRSDPTGQYGGHPGR